MNEQTQGQDGCRRRLVVARRGMSRREKWHGRQKIPIGRCPVVQELPDAREASVGEMCIRTKHEERIQGLRERVRILHEGRKGAKD
jgi:hypothetical protein